MTCPCENMTNEARTFRCPAIGGLLTPALCLLCRKDNRYLERWIRQGSPFANQPPGTGGPPPAKPKRPMPSRACNAKQMPKLRKQAWNLATSLAAFAADGLKFVSEDEYKDRLEVCDACGKRSNHRCSACGCRLSLKARGRAFECPLGKWAAENQLDNPE